MKKSLLALAVLGAFAGTAMAQSSVTIYGKIDQAVGKPIGSRDKQVMDHGGTAGSRIGFRGVEDLGGGLAAVFGFEHRFLPDTGESASPRFWNGYSTVGLRSAWGTVNLGRQYVPAFTHIQNQIDPFGGDTQGQLRDVGMRPVGSGIARVRVSDSIRYDFSAAGFNVAASIAEATQEAGSATGPDRPWSLAGNYSAGPLFVGVGYEDPQGANDKLLSAGVRYAFGPATLSVGGSVGKTNLDRDTNGWLVGVNWKLGPGDLKAAFGQSKVENAAGEKMTTSSKVGVGYHYNLSKRTKLYADVGRDSKVTTPVGNTSKLGYDLGIQHNF
jgi:predicted porin